MSENIKPESEFPHIEWLAENAEFVKENPLLKEAKSEIGGFKRFYYDKYANAKSEAETQKLYAAALKKSVTIGNYLVDWQKAIIDKWDDTPESTPGAETPQPASEEPIQKTAAVEIVNGEATSEAEEEAARLKAEQEEAERVAAEQPKEEGSGSVLRSFAAILGVATAIFLGVKFLKK